jgi:hypothetical protein
MDQRRSSPTITGAPSSNESIAGDILYGADSIAAYLYGDAKQRRKVYNLIEADRLPHFRLGAMICARKSILLRWISVQENFAESEK